jgi:hypothetical protein
LPHRIGKTYQLEMWKYRAWKWEDWIFYDAGYYHYDEPICYEEKKTLRESLWELLLYLIDNDLFDKKG